MKWGKWDDIHLEYSSTCVYCMCLRLNSNAKAVCQCNITIDFIVYQRTRCIDPRHFDRHINTYTYMGRTPNQIYSKFIFRFSFRNLFESAIPFVSTLTKIKDSSAFFVRYRLFFLLYIFFSFSRSANSDEKVWECRFSIYWPMNIRTICIAMN